MKPGSRYFKGNRQRGSILVFVLLMLLLGAAIVTSFKYETFARIRYYSSQYERDDLRLKAYSQLEFTLAVLSEIKQVENGLYAPSQGWIAPYEYARIEPPEGVSIEVKDEGGKLPLANMTEDRMLILFEEMGIDYDTREDLLNCYLDWTDEDEDERLSGADNSYYEDIEEPYQPTNGPLVSFKELALIKTFDTLFFSETGQPAAMYKQFTDSVSLYNNGKVNINTASDLVIRVLAREYGYDPEILLEYIAGEDGVRGSADDEVISGLDDPYFPQGAETNTNLLGVATDMVEINIKVRDGGGGVFTLKAIFSTAGSSDAGVVAGKNSKERASRANQRERQTTRTAETSQSEAAGKLNYPFEYIRISENYDF